MINTSSNMPEVLVPLAHGTEEMEAVIIIDILRRAEWTVTVTGIEQGLLTASRGVRLLPDKHWREINPSDFDILVIPGGGPGVEKFLKFKPLLDTILQFYQAHKWVAAVCAAPLTLQAAGILDGKKATCHPAVESRMTVTPRLTEPTVVDGHIVTSQGAGTTFDFALTLVSLVDNPVKAQAIAAGIVFNR